MPDPNVSTPVPPQPDAQTESPFDEDDEAPAQPPAGPGAGPASKGTIVATGVYLGALTLLCLYFLVALWPHPLPNLGARVAADTASAGAAASADSAARAAASTRPATTSPGTTSPGATPRRTPGATATPGTTSPGTSAVTTSPGTTTPGTTTPATTSAATTPAGGAAAAAEKGRAGLVACGRGCAIQLMRAQGDTALADCMTRAAALARDTVPDPQCVTVLRVGSAAWRVVIWDEQRILLLILLAGALGALLQSLGSLVFHVGHRWLIRAWLPQYYLQPFAGALIAVVLYVVVRGGFFSSSAPVQFTSPFGFIALALVAGLFLNQAMLKLKKIAETMFEKVPATPPPTGAAPPAAPAPPPAPAPAPGSGAPGISAVSADASGSAATTLTITGTGFTAASRVSVNGEEHAPASQSGTKLTVALTTKDRDVLDKGGDLTVTVLNPADAGGASAPFQFFG